jgi:hypothetical protein
MNYFSLAADFFWDAGAEIACKTFKRKFSNCAIEQIIHGNDSACYANDR